MDLSYEELAREASYQVPYCVGNLSAPRPSCGKKAVYKDCYHDFHCCEEHFQKHWSNHHWHVKQSAWEKINKANGNL
jgi:hypothetical protein